MKVLTAKKIRDTVSSLCQEANMFLRPDVLSALKKAYLKEKNRKARNILGAIISNALIAAKEELAICQDTGMPCVFVEIGQEVMVLGDLKTAINRGIELGYRKGSLRRSIVSDPVKRGEPRYQPAVIHSDILKGRNLKLCVLPKGFGCENKAMLKMFKPTAQISEIKKFIIESVESAGPDACPPYIVGVGIGGTADYAMFMAKRALLRNISIRNTRYATGKLESALIKEINKLDIGPMGLGGKATCLGVNIESYPTHIAGLPIAVNISCHALRSATAVL